MFGQNRVSHIDHAAGAASSGAVAAGAVASVAASEGLCFGPRPLDADPAAAAAAAGVKADGDPTGVPPVPVATIHSIKTPVVVVEEESAYRDVVTAAGNGERLVQAFIDQNVHGPGSQSAPERAAALDALMRWIETGAKPTPQQA